MDDEMFLADAATRCLDFGYLWRSDVIARELEGLPALLLGRFDVIARELEGLLLYGGVTYIVSQLCLAFEEAVTKPLGSAASQTLTGSRARVAAPASDDGDATVGVTGSTGNQSQTKQRTADASTTRGASSRSKSTKGRSRSTSTKRRRATTSRSRRPSKSRSRARRPSSCRGSRRAKSAAKSRGRARGAKSASRSRTPSQQKTRRRLIRFSSETDDDQKDAKFLGVVMVRKRDKTGRARSKKYHLVEIPVAKVPRKKRVDVANSEKSDGNKSDNKPTDAEKSGRKSDDGDTARSRAKKVENSGAVDSAKSDAKSEASSAGKTVSEVSAATDRAAVAPLL